MIAIYKIINPNNKIYIGQSWNVKNRKSKYKNSNCKGQTKLYNSILKYGWNNHIFEIQCEFPENISQDILDESENFYWKHYKNKGFEMLNLREPLGNYGKHSEESKKIMREKRKIWFTDEKRKDYSVKNSGINSPRFGSKNTEDHNKKISASNKGRIRSVECSKKLKDIANSEEYKKKQRESKLGSKNGMSRKIIVYSLDNNVIGEYSTMRDSAKSLGLSHISGIYQCCSGKIKSHKGYIFKYQ